MKRALVTALFLITTASVRLPAAHAQPAFAVGKPLPANDLPAGTVTVRVVSTPGAAVAGHEVRLTVGAQRLNQATGADGRARFDGLAAGATVRAEITRANGQAFQSEPFVVPASGGLKVMLATEDWSQAAPAGDASGPAAAAPASGAATPAGMPAPRALSGEARQAAENPQGTLSVRLSYDDFADATPPSNHPVYLVAYGADDTIKVMPMQTDAQGRVRYSGLDVSGATTYFALTLLPRNGAQDRLMSSPLQLGKPGMAMTLASEKRASTAPAIDDLSKFEKEAAAPAGKVRIAVGGIGVAQGTMIELVDAQTGKALTQAAAPAGGEQGATVELDVSGVSEGTVVYGRTYFDRADQARAVYHTEPFQVVTARGASVTLYIFPRVMMAFSLNSDAEDELLGVRGQFTLNNYAWAPYRQGPDGTVITLPKGFKGAILAPEDEAWVSTDPEGFRLVRPLPPGQTMFRGGFSLGIAAGTVAWDWPLPLGAYESGIEFLVPAGRPDLTVTTSGTADHKFTTVPQGRYLVFPSLTIMPGQRMVMRLEGFPTVPAWKLWAPRLTGLAVLGILLVGLGLALTHRAGPNLAAKRERLLRELAELDSDPASSARRQAIMTELEAIWPHP